MIYKYILFSKDTLGCDIKDIYNVIKDTDFK